MGEQRPAVTAEPYRTAGAFGMLAAFCHGAGFLALGAIDAAYRPGPMERWYYAALQHEDATRWSAALLCLGAMMLVAWVAGLARSIGPYSWPGAALVAVGATLQVAGSLLPYVVVAHVPHGEAAIGQTLLGMALVASAAYCFAVGAGVVVVSLGLARALHFPMWLSGWGLIAGMLTMGAVGQAWTPVSADFVFFSAPVCGAWLVASSLALLRLPAPAALPRPAWAVRRGTEGAEVPREPGAASACRRESRGVPRGLSG